jgi:hypothetical protein
MASATCSDMAQSDNSDQPDAGGRRRIFISAVNLPPDLLATWWERLLAVVAIALVVWTLADIVRNGP